MAGTCKRDDKPSGTIKCGNFFTNLGPVSFSGTSLLSGVIKSVPNKTCTMRRSTKSDFRVVKLRRTYCWRLSGFLFL